MSNFIGRLAVNEQGYIGRIDSVEGNLYIGTRVFTNAVWKTRKPIILSDADVEGIDLALNMPSTLPEVAPAPSTGSKTTKTVKESRPKFKDVVEALDEEV